MSVYDLSNYESIESNLFVKIECPYYKTSAGATPISYNFLFSDRIVPTTIDSSTYTGLGKLLSISNSQSELRSSPSEVSVTVSGLPNSSLSEIVHSRIKGSKITIFRSLFDVSTNQLISISPGNPHNRMVGIIQNVGLEEDFDTVSRTSSNTIIFTASSIVDVLDNKISGRKTNPSSMKKYYPTDTSFDKVPTIENSYFNFGATK